MPKEYNEVNEKVLFYYIKVMIWNQIHYSIYFSWIHYTISFFGTKMFGETYLT